MKTETKNLCGMAVNVVTVEKGDVKPIRFKEMDDFSLKIIITDELPEEFVEGFNHELYVFKEFVVDFVKDFNQRFGTNYNTILIEGKEVERNESIEVI